MDHAKQKTRICKGCTKPMEWSSYPETYKEKQYKRADHARKNRHAVKYNPPCTTSRAFLSAVQPARAFG